MLDYLTINQKLVGAEKLPEIPEKLVRSLTDLEALIWIPKSLSRDWLNTTFGRLPILGNQLVMSDKIETELWIKTSILNEPSFLELSAKEFDYITRKMGVHPFSLEMYLYVQWFSKTVFGNVIDREYWTWLPKTHFDRSGLLIGGVDRLGQFDFHGWMPDFQASFCGGRYYYTSSTPPKETSLVSLEWEYDKREMSFKYWISKVEKGDEESKFAAYHLLRDLEMMRLYLEMFKIEKIESPNDLINLERSWSERLAKQNKKKIVKLAVEQVYYYQAMLDDLVGYIISGMKQSDAFVPYRIANGFKNLRNYFLVVRLLVQNEGIHSLDDLFTKLQGIIKKAKEFKIDSNKSRLLESLNFYLGYLKVDV